MHRKMNPHAEIEAWPRRVESPARGPLLGPWFPAVLTLGGVVLLCLLALGEAIQVKPKVPTKASVAAVPEVADKDPFEAKAPAVRPAVVLPAPGQTWVLRPISGDPFEPKEAGMVTVIAVKQGWVRYGTRGVHDSDERKELSRFLLVFQPAPK